MDNFCKNGLYSFEYMNINLNFHIFRNLNQESKIWENDVVEN